VSRGFWAAIGVLAIATGAGWWWWTREVEMQDLIDKLTDALPGRIGQWARQLAHASQSTAPREVGPLRWGILLGAIMDRESRGGTILSPHGEAGTGDAGHGHGLMQIDDRYESERNPTVRLIREQLITSGDWAHADLNVLAAARILRAYYDEGGGDLPRAVAAYNAGSKVFGLDDFDAATTDNYSSTVLALAGSFEQALPA
jgi:hypothetical protein